MPLSATMPFRTGRMKLPQGTVFWHEGGQTQADTLVVLHGSWHDSSQGLPLLQGLASTYHCLAPDLLGFGESVRQGNTPYSVALQVEALHSLLCALRINRCRLVGHSLGAWVAGRYALTYPDRVQSLAVIAPEGVTEPGLEGRWRRDRWLVAPWSPLPLVLPRLGRGTWAKALRDRRRQLRQCPAACQILFQRRAAAIQGELLQQGIRHLPQPTLVISTHDDDAITRRLTQTWLHLQPQAQTQTLPAAGTLLGVEASPLAAALLNFMDPQTDLETGSREADFRPTTYSVISPNIPRG
jgi:pimeloyl-ACP methyl ester carboxylesterase